MADDGLPPVPPLTAAGFADPVWARWFKAVRKRVIASISNLVVTTANGFGGSVTLLGTTQATLNLRTTVTGMVKGNGTALSAATAGVDYSVPADYGHFHGNTTQTALAATATPITLNTTIYSNGVALGIPASRIVFSHSGFFRIFFSVQFANSSASYDDVTVWTRYNGVDMAESSGIATVNPKHGATDGRLLVTRNDLFLLVNAGDYLELYWATDGGTTSITSYPAGVGPAHPSSPGVVFIAQQIN